MPQSSNYLDILSAVATAITNLALTDWNSRAVPVVVRKMSSYRAVVDANYAPPVIYVSPGKRDRVEYPAFGDRVWVWYPVEISTIAGGNQDLNAHIDYYFMWRQQIRRALQAPTLTGAAAVWDNNMLPDRPIDPGAISKNYDILLLTVEYRTTELRDLT